MPIKKEVIIGDCRLILGDCLEVMPTLGKVDAAWTDPPYNVGKDYGTCKDNLTTEDYYAWSDEWITGVEKLTDNIAIYPPKIHLRWFWNRLPETHQVIMGWTPAGCFRSGYIHQYAPLLMPKKTKTKCKDFWLNVKMSGLGYFFKEENFNHPGLTSLDCTRRVLSAISNPGDTILDIFSGTGTTGVVCAQMKRKYIGIELNEDYFNISVERVRKAYEQPDMFVDQPKKKPEQGNLTAL